MFRCITELKGVIVDIDSFSGEYLFEWNELTKLYKCVFITSDERREVILKEWYGKECVFKVENFEKFFAPSRKNHEKCLEKLGVLTTEIAYVSADIEFLDHAMGFMCGSIWITNTISYEEASRSPDLVCSNLTALTRILENKVKGYLGEVAVYPNGDNTGIIIPVEFIIDEKQTTLLYMLGRYFGYSHYMNQLHPYSSGIYLNKKEGKKYYGILNQKFASLYAVTVEQIKRQHKIDGVCAVPVRPGKDERFKDILNTIAERCGIQNLGSHFECTNNYPSQKGLSQSEREENVAYVFKYNGSLKHMNVIILDDIVTTGATIRECIRELKRKGANQVFIVSLAVNQLGGAYWSSNVPAVSCPHCKYAMHLYINSKTNDFFYLCYNCHSTLDFEYGQKMISDQVNSETLKNNEDFFP